MSQENVEVVRRWYASAPDLRDTDPQDDRAFADRAFRDYLDERVELRLSERYPEGETVFGACGTRGPNGGSSLNAASMPGTG
jgi:hypothetical protein